jgi:hypothetical protein
VVLAESPKALVEGKEIRIEFDRNPHSRVIAKFDGKEISIGGFSASEFITESRVRLRQQDSASEV